MTSKTNATPLYTLQNIILVNTECYQNIAKKSKKLRTLGDLNEKKSNHKLWQFLKR